MSDYSSRSNDAVNKVLVEIGQVLASYKDALVLVGGIVPGLIPSLVTTLQDVDNDSQ